MKKICALVMLFIALALTACAGADGKSAEPEDIGEQITNIEEQIKIISPEPVTSEQPEPTPDAAPLYEPGIAAGYGVGACCKTVDRGTEVDIIGEDEEYYIVLYEDTELYVEKRFIRDVNAESPKERTAYAGYGAQLFVGPYLTGEPLEKPAFNTALTILDEFGGLMIVKTKKSEGYIDAAFVSPVRVPWSDGANNSGDSGQKSGGSAYTGGTDGGDITLGNRRTETAVPILLSARYEPKSADKLPARGVILADGTELYLGIVYPGDELMILSAEGKTAEIYTPRGTGTLPRWAVLLGDEEPYDAWNGYASYGAKLFGSWRLTGANNDIRLNTRLTVILETDNGYFVQLSDGRYGYVDRAAVSRTMIVIENNDEDPGAAYPEVGEWTEPVL